MRRTLPTSLRKILLQEYPGLGNHQGHWNHILRLIFAKDGIAKVGVYQVAYDYGESLKTIYGHFSSKEKIELFWQEVTPYELITYEDEFGSEHEYSYFGGICREGKLLLTPRAQAAIEDYKAGKFKDEKKVFTATGETVTHNNKGRLREQDQKVAEGICMKGKTKNSLQRKFLDYLNSLASNRFSKILKYLPQARSVIQSSYINDEGEVCYYINPETWDEQERILDFIGEQPQPFYTPSPKGNTVRIFQFHPGLQGVHSYLREILTQDWLEVDLRNAHVAIVARLWDIPELQEYLKQGISIWLSLLTCLGFDPADKKAKQMIKPLVFSVIYGMGEQKLRQRINVLMQDEAGYGKFANHPIVKSLLEARKNRVKKIAKAGKWKTPFGEEIQVRQYKNKQGEFTGNIPSILSQEANEIEMLLLEPVLDIALASKGEVDLVLYQFDGVSLAFKNPSKKDRWLKRIIQAVQERADKLGIYTGLEVK